MEEYIDEINIIKIIDKYKEQLEITDKYNNCMKELKSRFIDNVYHKDTNHTIVYVEEKPLIRFGIITLHINEIQERKEYLKELVKNNFIHYVRVSINNKIYINTNPTVKQVLRQLENPNIQLIQFHYYDFIN
jgi:hypothetical protein